jgi:hypothetical protein
LGQKWVVWTAPVYLDRAAVMRFSYFSIHADAFERAMVEWVGPVEMPLSPYPVQAAPRFFRGTFQKLPFFHP